MSNYATPSGDWNHEDSPVEGCTELLCHRCHGSGRDREGADCLYCEGMGSVLSDY